MQTILLILTQDVLQAVDSIPIHIGAVELKTILYNRILPLWSSYTEGFPLQMEDVIMRNKDWVEICPQDPDHDVIARPFFQQGKNGASIFKTGRCIINFHIPNAIYDLYVQYAEQKELEREAQVEVRLRYICSKIDSYSA